MVPSNFDTPGSQQASPWSAGAILAGVAAIAGIVAAGIAAMDYMQKQPPYDLSGWWRVTNTIQSAKLSTFQGLQLEFEIIIHQNGLEFVGKGEMVSEGGREIQIKDRTKLDIDTGTISGMHAKATFTEFGKIRPTQGTFEWVVEPGARSMSGRFISFASDSHGTSKAERIMK